MKYKSVIVLAFVLFSVGTVAWFVQRAVIYIKAEKARTFWFEFKKKDTSDFGIVCYKLEPNALCANDKGVCSHSCAACRDTGETMDIRKCSHTHPTIPYAYKRNYILLAPYVPTENRFSTLIITDFAGKIVMQKNIDGIVGDFRQWNINGHIRYSYAVYDPEIFLQNYVNGSVAQQVILDSTLNEIKRVNLLTHGDIVVDGKQNLDHHDLIMISDNHYITMASYVKTVTNIPSSLSPAPSVKAAVPVIQEVRDSKVVWQWDASLYPEFYMASLKGNKFSDGSTVQDYMHINGITIDPKDSNLIASFHNTNQLVKINRKTGDIIWRLGGRNSDFALTNEQVFLRQHNPSFIDSGTTLLLFDNGDNTLRPFSRVLEFKLNETEKKITFFKSFRIPAPFALSKGNVQLFGDDYFICGGSANYILKVNRETGKVKTEIVYNQTSFRAYITSDVPGIRK